MLHVLYMTFINKEFKSKEISLFFILLCRFTYFWTPLFVSVYDSRLSIFMLFDRMKCKSHTQQLMRRENGEELVVAELKVFDIERIKQNLRYDIHE